MDTSSPDAADSGEAPALPPSPRAPEALPGPGPLLPWCAVPAGAATGLAVWLLKGAAAAVASGWPPAPSALRSAWQSTAGGALLALGLVVVDRLRWPRSRPLRWFMAAAGLRAVARVIPTILLLAHGLGPLISGFGLWPHIAQMVAIYALLAGLLAALVARFARQPQGLGWRCASAGLVLGMSGAPLNRLAALAILPGALAPGHAAGLWAGMGREMLEEGVQHAAMALAIGLCLAAAARRSREGVGQ